jgi:hypothetical protein
LQEVAIVGKKKGQAEVKKGPRRRSRLLVPGLIVGVVSAGLAWNWVGTRSEGRAPTHGPSVPDGYMRRETRTPLSPALFVGKTARSYQVANEIPDVLDQIYCYCECDKHMGHRSLLSCFTDTHGAT